LGKDDRKGGVEDVEKKKGPTKSSRGEIGRGTGDVKRGGGGRAEQRGGNLKKLWVTTIPAHFSTP